MKISETCMISCIVEAGTFKPGNIYPGKRGFLDFVVSAVLLGKTIEKVCNEREVHLGRFVKEAVLERKRFVASNTNLGIIMLCMPIAVAATKGVDRLEKTVNELVRSTTTEDAVEIAETVKISGAFLGEPENGPDLRFEKGLEEVRYHGTTLLELFLISSKWDSIASEWVNGFPITFSGAEMLLSGRSVLHLYMEILSRYPDSLVQRRFGKDIAKRISRKAKELLSNFSLDNLKRWDRYLCRKGINPGTTADLVASSVFVALLRYEELLKRFLDEL